MCEFDGELKDLGVVPAALLEALDDRIAANAGLWETEDANKPNRFDAFRESTMHIIFQFPLDFRSHRESRYSPLWPDWRPVLEPLIAHATSGYGYADGRTARIMLAKLAAGRSVARHIDKSPSAEVPHKIHIPVQTNPDVRFLIDTGEYGLERGRAYEVNNRRPHEVRNHSTMDRVHLIFDYYAA
jgi:hypothetical protein